MITPMSPSSSSSTSSISTNAFSTSQKKSMEEKIPWLAEGEAEKKLAHTLAQIQRNEGEQLNLSLASFGRFYEQTEPSYVFSGHQNWVRCLAVLHKDLLVSGSLDKTIKLWDLTSHSCLSALKGHVWSVLVLAILPNGQLASGSYDNTIKLWDLASHSCLFTLQGHTCPIFALAVLPNGQLASGSSDHTIKLWDLASCSCLSTLKGHTGWVNALAVLPNGQLASGSGDNTIKLWNPKIISLSAKTLQPILKALSLNTSVTDLNLSGNPQVADDIIDPLIELLTSKTASDSKPNTTLKTIDLRQTGVTWPGIEKLKKAIQAQSLSITLFFDETPKPKAVRERKAKEEEETKATKAGDDQKVTHAPKKKSHPELRNSGKAHESLELEIKWVRAVKAHRINELNILLSMDKRLVKIAIEDHKSLLSFALEQKSLAMARLAIHRLGKGIQDIPELEVMNRMELFRKAAHQLGAEGSKLIGNALEPSAYQAELWWGIQHRDAALVQTTLELKADPADLNGQGLRPIHVAAEMEDEKMISILAQYGQIDNVDAKGHTALHRAILKNHPHQVRLLTTHHADVRKMTPQHLTSLELSFEQRKTNHESLLIARNLLEHKADPNVADSQHQPLLLKAMESGLLDWMRLLISYGADVNIPCSKGELLIHRAFLLAGKELASILQILLQGKANLEAKDEAGHTPLLKAVSIEPIQLEAVAILLKAKANIEAVDSANGNTSLHIAAEKGSDAIVKLLMEAGANPKVRNRANLRPLKLAKNAHRSNVVEFLRTKSLERRMRPFVDPLQKQIAEQQKQISEQRKQIAEQKLEIERLKQALAKAQPCGSQGLNNETAIQTTLALVSSSSRFWNSSASSSSSLASIKTSSTTSAATFAISS